MPQMTAEEFKAARIKLGLSVAQLAEILDTNASTISRWESPESAVTKTPLNPTAARVMQWMIAGFRPPQWPDLLRAQRRGRRPKKAKPHDDEPKSEGSPA